MDLWLVWILIAVGLGVAEIASLSFFLGPYAVGALAAAATDAAGAPTAASIAVFIVVGTVSLLVVRPIAQRHVRTPPQIRTGTDALVGKVAVVVERIDNDASIGAVKIDGETWTARAYDGDEDGQIASGKRVHVVEIRGATALVSE